MNDPKRRHRPPPSAAVATFSSPSSSSSSSSSSSTNPNPNPSPPPPPLASPSPPLPQASSLHYPGSDTSLLKFQTPYRTSSAAIARAPPLIPPRSASTLFLPLSPQESNSTLTLSDSSSGCAGDPHRLLQQQQTAEACVQSCSFNGVGGNGIFKGGAASSASFCSYHPPHRSQIQGVSSNGATGNGPNGAMAPGPSFADLPIVRGPVAFQVPVQKPCLQRMEDPDSKRLKLVLEDLERELLGDDDSTATAIASNTVTPVAASSPNNGNSSQQLTAKPEKERDWTDVIEELLNSPDQQAAASNITSICSNPNSCTDDGFLSAADSSSPSTTTLDYSSLTTVCTSSKPPPPPSSSGGHVQPRDILLACASAINIEDYSNAETFLSLIQQSASIYGDPCQRLAVYMAAALEARIEKAAMSQNRRRTKLLLLAPSPPPTPEMILRGKQLLYKWCLCMKFGLLAANQAMLEVMEREQNVHIMDFSICSYGANQWPLFLDALSRRRAATATAPRVRITGVAAAGGGREAELVGRVVVEHGRRVGVEVEYRWVVVREGEEGEAVVAKVERRAGEALAVNWVFYLHTVADESLSEKNPRDGLLRAVSHHLRPVLVTLVEHDANTNTPPFYPRFLHSLDYFAALFQSLDGKSMRDNKDRVNAERHWLGRHIADIVACEGAERRQRYDVAAKWRARMAMAGFRSIPLPSGDDIRQLLCAYSRKYTLQEDAGMLRLGWGSTPLVAASAWRPLPS